MKLSYIKAFHLLTVFAVIILITGCSKNPTTPVNNIINTVDINILVQDENGKPFSNVEVTFYPDNVKSRTDSYGKASIQIAPGEYQIILYHPDLPMFYKDVFFDKNQNMDIKFIVATKVNITVAVKDVSGNPISGLEISTYPSTFKVDTNSSGLAVFENVPVRSYIFIVSRGEYSLQTPGKKLVVKNGKLEDVIITLGSQKPAVTIISPVNRLTQNVFNIKLEGKAADFEDGVLPAGSLTWLSNIDGELGHGYSLNIERLSVGKHIITLRAEDSEGNFDEKTVELFLYYYEPLSYFPIPGSGQWEYQYDSPSIKIINDKNIEEEWIFQNLKVEMESVDCRKSTMNYLIKTANSEKTCEYWVKDYYETDLENIYISKTEESMKFWKINSTIYDIPDQSMHVISEYNPRYLMIKKHIDPLSGGNFKSNVTADVTWYYDDIEFGSQTYKEQINFDTSVNLEGFETISSGAGTFDALKYVINQGQTSRTWWLAKSYGMVQLEFSSLGFPLKCVLAKTNMGDFLDDTTNGQAASKRPIQKFRPVTLKLDTKSGTSERSKEMCKILRSISPR
jgi:hypothetical protein